MVENKLYPRMKYVRERVDFCKAFMEDHRGKNWLYEDPNTLDLHERLIKKIAIIFDAGYDRIYVDDPTIKPMVPDSQQSSMIRKKWEEYLNKYVEQCLKDDYKVFMKLYDTFEREHWSGNCAWKVLSAEVSPDTIVIRSLKNYCWFKHLEGNTITFDAARQLLQCFTTPLYEHFYPPMRIMYDEDTPAEVIYNDAKINGETTELFVDNVLFGTVEQGYAMIADEVRAVMEIVK